MDDKPSNLIWIDLEMTGLDTLRDSILEIATLITDSELNILALGPNLAIYHSEEILQKMDAWNTKHHTQSGLIARVQASKISLEEAEKQTLAFVQQYTAAGESPMCGNTICQDRRFLHRLMPKLEAHFHYRHLDVSTVKELAKRWMPSLFKNWSKDAPHLALEDIKLSVEELRYYRENFFRLDTPGM